MYPIHPSKAYVHARVNADPRWMKRADAMLKALGNPTVDQFTNATVPDLVRANPWTDVPSRTQSLAPDEQPVVVLNTFEFGTDEQAVAALEDAFKQCPSGTTRELVARLIGRWVFDNWSPSIRSREQMCRCGYEWNPIWGCLHHCRYCQYGGSRLLVVAMNVEEMFQQRVVPVMDANPDLTVWRYEMSTSDALCVEPEYGATRLCVESFAHWPDRYFLIHTKSDNVDHLLDLDHNGHTIMVWSLTSHSVSRRIERESATTEPRVEAARRCQAAGYPVRIKFKPIVPVAGWRNEARDMIDHLLYNVEPEIIGLCTLMWTTMDELDVVYDLDQLDPRHVEAARTSASTMHDRAVGPFPDHVRAEIYDFYITHIRRRHPDVPISLCTETTALWQQFGQRLGYGPRDYVCGCGSRSTPGLRRLPTPEHLSTTAFHQPS